jgi:hypothetical protein
MSIDGTWNVTLQSPMGSQEGTLTLATDGDALTGTMSGPQGAMDIEDGQVGDGSYSWKVNITSPMAITIESTATVDGDTITGESKLGAFGTATFTGTRA